MSLKQMQWLPCESCGDNRLHDGLGCTSCRTPHHSQTEKATEQWMTSYALQAAAAKKFRVKSAMSRDERLARRRERRAQGRNS